MFVFLFVIDLAVGAPFGEGSGTVFIYSGVGGDEMLRQTQVSLRFKQVIDTGFIYFSDVCT